MKIVKQIFVSTLSLFSHFYKYQTKQNNIKEKAFSKYSFNRKTFEKHRKGKQRKFIPMNFHMFPLIWPKTFFIFLYEKESEIFFAHTNGENIKLVGFVNACDVGHSGEGFVLFLEESCMNTYSFLHELFKYVCQ